MLENLGTYLNQSFAYNLLETVLTVGVITFIVMVVRWAMEND